MNGFAIVGDFVGQLRDLLSEPTVHGVGVWFLALTFAVSGIAKLRRPTLAAMAMVDFGVLRSVRTEFGLALGLGELLLALWLASHAAERASLFVASALLWLFVFLIARQLVAGKTFPCFCFGDSDSSLSSVTLARAQALALLASALAVFTPLMASAHFEGTLMQLVSATSLVAIFALTFALARLMGPARAPAPRGSR